MNPIIVFVLFMLLYQENNHFPNHFDTFGLEKLLDQLNHAVVSLDRINHLNELAHEPFVKGNITHTIEDSIHTVKPLFPDGKPQEHLDTIESVIESFKKIGNLQKMAQNIGPMLNMLNNMPTGSFSETDDTDSRDYSQLIENKEDPYL
ncbi:hypothetical protein [Aminipila luticellarii]|uniref:Uncharacterized protein n=1 Tax=Aminipila luticellarii TaxID=2507160 RepID=A0A410PX21_9FIRM|nr:hypothetical protein [Aminipila luticellarii]QAT43487.1 hypothetical protein EQM06_09815 [Aminipila luticellarii]